MPLSSTFIYISLRAPVKAAPPPGSPHRAPTETHSNSRALFLPFLKIPRKQPSAPGSPMKPLSRERDQFPEPSFTAHHSWSPT